VPAPVWTIRRARTHRQCLAAERHALRITGAGHNSPADPLRTILQYYATLPGPCPPPLSPLLTRITGLLGVSPTAVRIIPALAGGAVVVAAARFAALFGAGRLGRVLAALTMACAPVVIGAVHLGNTTPLDLLAWTAVLLCVTTALLRHRPRWWLGAGAAAGVGLENDNLLVLLLIGLALGILVSEHRCVLRTRWPWLGAGIAAVIWAPNIIWQATHGWPQLAMFSALHQQNSSLADYAGGLPAQLVYLGLLGQLRPYFASCRLLTTYYAPYHVQNDWTDLQIGVCTGPVASWRTLWPHLKHYG
jgi:4-amino-4-deoxy-L-arabinose transferase-like glycosyltransferase